MSTEPRKIAGRSFVCAAVMVTAGMTLSLAVPAAAAGAAALTRAHVRQNVVHATAPAPAPNYALNSGQALLKSSTGRMLSVSVAARNTPYAQQPEDEIDVYLGKLTSQTSSNFAFQGESYSFNNVNPAQFKLTGTGKSITKAVIKMGAAQWGSTFGAFSLTFTPKSHTDTVCTNASQGYYDRKFTGMLTGSLTFDTSQNGSQTSAWGKVSSSSIAFSAQKSATTLDVNNGCQTSFPPPGKSYCSKDSSFASPTQRAMSGSYTGTKSIGGDTVTTNGVTSRTIYADRTISITGLPSSATGSRSDSVPVTGSRSDSVFEEQSFPVSGVIGSSKPWPLKVTAGPAHSTDKLFTGSAGISITKSGRTSSTCTLNSTKNSPKKTEYSYVSYITSGNNYTQVATTWANGSAKLSANAGVGGHIFIKNGTDSSKNSGKWGFVEESTYS